MSKTLATAPASPAPAAPAPAGGTPAPAKGAGGGAAVTPPVAAPAAGAAEGGKPKETKAKATPAAAEPEIPALGADVDDADGEQPEIPALGDDVEGEATDAEGDEATDDDAAGEGEDDAEAELVYEFPLEEGEEPYRQPVIDAYTEALRRNKIAPEAAQDILRSVMPVIRSEAEAATKEHIEATTKEWRAELQERHGAKLGEVMKLANRALAKAASPALRKFLGESALAANPDFIDALAWFGRRVTNDRTVMRNAAPAAQDLDPVEELAREYDAADKQRGS